MLNKPTYEELEKNISDLEKELLRQKDAEKALRKSEELFKRVFQTSPDSVTLTGPDGEYIDVNRGFITSVGYTREEALGETSSNLNLWVDESDLNELRRILGEKGFVQNFETQFYKKDGSISTSLLSASVFEIDGVWLTLSITREISDLKKAEAAHRESEEKYKTIFETVPTSIIMLAKDGQIVDINPHYVTSLGEGETKKEDYLGENLVSHPDTVNAKLSEAYKKVLEGESFDKKDVYFPTPTEGTDSYFNVKGAPLFKDKEIIGAVITHEDVTQRKHLEEHLVKAKEEAEAGNKAKSDFLSNMSHELRTPMQGILGYAHLAIERIDNLSKEKILQYIKQMKNSGNRLLYLLNDLLDLSKLEAGLVEYSFSPVNLSKLVQVPVYELGALLKEKNISVNFLQPDFDDLGFMDSQKIMQVIRNLLSNAIKFSDAGSEIDIKIEDDTDNLAFSICNRGVGLPGTELEAVFDKFVQSSKTKTSAGGTGLGLAICKNIISDHKGIIWAENNPDGGVIFRLRIPKTQCNTPSQLIV